MQIGKPVRWMVFYPNVEKPENAYSLVTTWAEDVEEYNWGLFGTAECDYFLYGLLTDTMSSELLAHFGGAI